MDFNYLQGLARFGSKPGLDRIQAILEALGDPQDAVPVIHIAGTNGKGSVAAMTAHILGHAGYRVGLFTSPHLTDYGERFMLNGSPASSTDLEPIMARVRSVAEDPQLVEALGHPTEFEVATAIAFQYFSTKADLVVLETGLGGRLDATNVIHPLVSVITEIALDHQDVLGETLQEIAGEKAGIIKEGRPVVIHPQQPAALAVIKKQAQSLKAPLVEVGRDVSFQLEEWHRGGTYISYRGREWAWPRLRINLLGPHQGTNAACAIAVVETLGQLGWQVEKETVEKALDTVQWPGRLELVERDGPVLFDGAHNPHGAQALARALTGLFPGEKPLMVIGILTSKDAQAMLASLLPAARGVVFTKPTEARTPPVEPAELARLAGGYDLPIWVVDDPHQAYQTARREAGEGLVCICGSLYLVGELRG
ncbi:MAG: bifunctional folylpolyglutamate synthase/dihydrofolate synthase [Limnochordia bacterium]|jgi:dihydrofolate synthase/folylpolyglutamate synthase